MAKNQQQHAVRREKREWRLPDLRGWVPKISLLVLVIGLLWAWSWLTNPEDFPVRQVQIKASYQHVDPDNLQRVIAPYLESGFFGLDAGQLKRQILQLPWVYAARVSRSWPGKVVIDITEQTAVALWNGNNLLNSSAEVFTPKLTTLPDDLPMLIGPEGQAAEVFHYYQRISKLLVPLGLEVKQLSCSPQRAWRLVLNNGIVMFLGSIHALQHVQLFIDEYQKVVGANGDNVQDVDLRYQNGFAVKWKHR